MTLGQKIKQKRNELKIVQSHLGDLCEVSHRTIVSYESDKSFPREKSFRNLFEALGITT